MRSAPQLRSEILGAARVEFARYGLAGARVDRIARLAHASKERLYAHFGDKEALFRAVFAIDGMEFYRSVTLRADAVAEFVGDVFDLATTRPEHLRMITWAKLEGFDLGAPDFDGEPVPGQAIAAIEAAQANGHIDPAWAATDLIVMLFAIGLAWAQSPHPDAVTDDPGVIAHRRAVAVDAGRRLIAARG
ncbi:TetR family transcriptional regulator [Mycolicibacterium bacteremicum]|uniref:TetR family transcriptional regulator n=1 Tax=Mycolicibacterium bacteremicum TaxID=564198 RepID=UPI0026F1F024|nr:TetR family transcriptional regulator [Mycolicibacterium bacteremicum]